MRCPKCGCTNSIIITQIGRSGNKTVRRIRECSKCSSQFVTYEYVCSRAKYTNNRSEADKNKFPVPDVHYDAYLKIVDLMNAIKDELKHLRINTRR